MWVKIETTPADSETIGLPPVLRGRVGDAVFVEFGGRRVEARAEYAGPEEGEGTYEAPFSIRLPEPLRGRLLLPASQVYRLLPEPGGIRLGPVIGLMLGVHTSRYDPWHMEKYTDRMGVYSRVGGLIYAFSPRTVDWQEHTACGLYYNIGSREWEYGRFPLPQVIYRRDFHCDPAAVRRLEAYTGGRLFNSHRFTKYDLFRYVGTDPGLRMFLPETEPVTDARQVVAFTDRLRRVILKPVDLSRGRGICVVETVGRGYRLTDYRSRAPVVRWMADREEFRRFLARNPEFFRRYLIQRYLRLARIGDSCFDIRVVMQKDIRREWICGGIECRVSGRGSHLTNISRGGDALTLPEALQRSFGGATGGLADSILDFCRRFCAFMDRDGEHFAEFGMDVAVDIHKNLWFIEANVFPSFKGFRRIDRPTYLAIRHTPLLYALTLSGFGEEEPAPTPEPPALPEMPDAAPQPPAESAAPQTWGPVFGVPRIDPVDLPPVPDGSDGPEEEPDAPAGGEN